MRVHRGTIILIAAAIAIAIAPRAWAQSNPSANQIIELLKPTAQSLKGPTRGIRPIAGGSAAEQFAPPTATATAARPRGHISAGTQTADASVAAPSVNLYVEFATGSAELTPGAMTSLDELGKALASNTLSSYRFRIEGHTDTVGSHPYNLALSEQRAAAVADYIEHKFGVDPGRLTSIGLGESHLLVPTPDQTPEARNRRVQVINVGA